MPHRARTHTNAEGAHTHEPGAHTHEQGTRMHKYDMEQKHRHSGAHTPARPRTLTRTHEGTDAHKETTQTKRNQTQKQ